MRPISIEGFEKPKSVFAGAAPMLQWLKITDLVVDPAYQRPIIGKGRQNVDRIAREFSWSCFAPVVVSPVEGRKFAIIDGQHRTTSAAIVGYESVPSQIVIAARDPAAQPARQLRVRDAPRAPDQDRRARHRAHRAHPRPAADELPGGSVVQSRRARPAAIRPMSRGAVCPSEPRTEANQPQTRCTASRLTPIQPVGSPA